jgi:predicted transcriptional regulator of viral defense system
MKRMMGRREAQVLAYLQMRKQTTLRAGELMAPFQLTSKQERELVHRMVRSGGIVRVRPGLYLAPPQLPLGVLWSPDEATALGALMEDCGGRYQVCGPNAFSRYGFDEQVPNRVYAYNNRIYGERTIGAVALTLIKVADERLGDTEPVQTAGGVTVPYSSRARTLVDAVYDWSRFGGLPRAFGWIRAELKAERVSASELVRLTLRYGDVGTMRRMGALLDREGASSQVLGRLERALKPSKSLIPWSPTRPKRGKVDRRWGVLWNDEA